MSKDESFEMVDSTQFDIEQGPSDSPAAGLLGSRFDEITTRSRFSLQGRKKKVAIVLGVFLTLWLAGTMVFLTGGADGVVDYYKNRVGMTGAGSPETDGEENKNDDAVPTVEDPPVAQEDQYKDSDEPMLNQGSDDKVPEDEVPTVEDPPKPDIELPPKEKKKLPITMADLGRLRVYSYPITFLHTTPEKDEGVYFFVERDDFVAKKVDDMDYTENILPKLSFEYDDKKFNVATFSPNPDLTWAIISTNTEVEFRHSSKAYYWLYNMENNAVTPVTSDDDKSIVKISYAKWSPKFNYITFLKDNDLYIKSLDATTTRITNDGSETIMNAKPDWEYEEEVLATEDALWWSPDESKVAFMKTNEKDVPQYNIDYYVQTPNGGATKYPTSKKITYPKPGFKNPEVSMEVYDIESKTTTTVDRKDSKLGEEYIIYDAFWLESEYLMIKETDRESNKLNVRMFNAKTEESKIVHEVDAVKEYNGWIEKMNSPVVVKTGEDGSIGYVDTYVVEGYNHLVYFSSPDAEPKPLTSGPWEVAKVPLGYDSTNGVIYFHGSKQPINQHLYSVSLSSGEISALTDDTKDAFHTARFSPSCKYAYLTSQNANELATSSIITMSDMKIKSPMTIETMYMAAKNQYAYPSRKFHRVDVGEYDDGTPVTVDVLEYQPPNFDEKKKYPLLVHYYAGPGAHVVQTSIEYAFEDVVSSSLDAIVLYVEPRGTGGAGWKHRSWANKNIGYWEPRDIVTVTKKWIEKGFVDTERTACWGWSYGGFTTLKTLEFDQGETFKYGMAVAPVTNWLLYDSIYTERYMDKPENNEAGYEVSQITDVGALSKSTRFLVMHGTADDNVHVQNTYNLLDRLNLQNVENYDVHVFPDSEHSIRYHNANPVVYDKLFSWLKDAFDGDYAKIGHK